MKKEYPIRLCPICGNDIPYSVIINNRFPDIRCKFCGSTFYKDEIVVERVSKHDKH